MHVTTYIFDWNRSDVLATSSDEQLLDATGDGEEPFFIHTADITRMQISTLINCFLITTKMRLISKCKKELKDEKDGGGR